MTDGDVSLELVEWLDLLAETALRLTEMARLAIQDAACPDTTICQIGLLSPETFPYVVLIVAVLLLSLTSGGRSR